MIVSGLGRLGQDPKMQFNAKGNAQTSLSAAVRCGWGDREQTVWVSLIAFGLQAEFLNQHLVKGNRVVFSAEVTGIRTYDKRDGTTGVSLDAKILTVELVDQAAKSEGADSQENPEGFEF